MSIKLSIDTARVKVRDIKQLERTRTFVGLTEWFVKFGGASMDELDELTLDELMGLAKESVKGLTDSALPNENGANSSLP